MVAVGWRISASGEMPGLGHAHHVASEVTQYSRL